VANLAISIVRFVYNANHRTFTRQKNIYIAELKSAARKQSSSQFKKKDKKFTDKRQKDPLIEAIKMILKKKKKIIVNNGYKLKKLPSWVKRNVC
jgi:hypothetical protein